MIKTYRLNLTGMSCVGRAERAVAGIDGVQNVAVNLATVPDASAYGTK
jgi:copper chaperone CopZ